MPSGSEPAECKPRLFMTSQELFAQIRAKRSFLCVGLDTDLRKLPVSLGASKHAIYDFNRAIIDATVDYAVAYKPNLAFYEALGPAGWNALELTIRYLREQHPNVFTIADAKRGDIANTAQMYAKSLFHNLGFHAATLAPYMGRDSVQPFLDYEGKWAILLAVTSNEGSKDFQNLPVGAEGKPLYQEVIARSRQWGHEGNMMYVVGATHPEVFQKVRECAPDHFLLVPGVGQQGGDFDLMVEHGMNSRCGLLVNSSRGILYASSGADYAQRAGDSAKALQIRMEKALEARDLL